MSGLLGRAEYQGRGWPTRWPVSSLGALALAVVVGIGIFTIQNGDGWPTQASFAWVGVSDHRQSLAGIVSLQPCLGDSGGTRNPAICIS